MWSIVPSAFADLVRVHERSTPDDVLAVFLKRFGATWATDVTAYVTEDVVKRNRPEYHQFYFDNNTPRSVRSDPRSGIFFRRPASGAGKIEILFHLAFGLEGFAQLLKIPRTIDGRNMRVLINAKAVSVDRSGFEADFDTALGNLFNPTAKWDDELLLPSFEDALFKAKDAFMLLAGSETYDEDALFHLANVVLCGAHCQTCGPSPDPLPPGEAADKMAKIMAISGAIRGAANRVAASTAPRTPARLLANAA